MKFIPVLQPTIASSLALYASTCLNRYNKPTRCCKSFLLTATSLFADATKQPQQPPQSVQPSILPKSVHVHTSFRDIVDQYDAFILDQFGVLHNGVHPLDGAIELIKYMYEEKKKLIVLSNTSAPSKNALQRLEQLGFPKKYFVDAITSGEEASRYVRMVYGTSQATGGTKQITKVIFLTWDVRIPNNPRLTALPQDFLDECCDGSNDDDANIQVTENIADADLVLLHGSEVWFRGTDVEPISLGSFIETGNCNDVIDPLLQQFIQYNLPLICANPDKIVVTPTNGKAYMPGKIVQRYQELGGTNCRLFGKPNVEHFEACIRKLQSSSSGIDITKDRVAHVGDSLYHDILGANNAGIPSIFITSGIHASQLTDINSGLIDSELSNDQYGKLYNLFEAEGSIYPTHVVPLFRL